MNSFCCIEYDIKALIAANTELLDHWTGMILSVKPATEDLKLTI